MKTPKIRRLTASSALIAATALALTACGGPAAPEIGTGDAQIGEAQSVGAMADFAAGTSFKATEAIEIGLLYRDHPNYPVQENWPIFEHIKADRNVTFKPRVDVPLADWDQKKALLIGAGDVPDIISVTYPGQETQFVAGGALLPISDYLQYMPNFSKWVADWGLEAEFNTHKQADGKIYQLPGLREVPDVQYTVVVNDDMWQKAGITEDPKTWDEFAEALAKVKAANPEIKYAMSDRWTDSTTLGAMLNYMAPNFKTEAGWGYQNNWFDQDSKKFVFNGTTEGYKNLVTYVAGLVSSGLLDPEITQNDDQAIQKFVSGETAAISGNTQEINSYRTKIKDAGKTTNVRLLVIPDGPAGGWLAGSQLSSGLMISSKLAEKPNFKATLQFIDWLYYTDEGIEFAQWGVEGLTFTKDANGLRSLVPDVGWNALNPDAPKKLNADFGFSNGVFMLANGSTKELLQSTMSDEVKEWTNAVLAKKQVLPVKPASGLNEMELEQSSLLDQQLKDAVQTATAGFITGQRPLSDWDKYVAEIQGYNADQLIEIHNTAFQRTAGTS